MPSSPAHPAPFNPDLPTAQDAWDTLAAVLDVLGVDRSSGRPTTAPGLPWPALPDGVRQRWADPQAALPAQGESWNALLGVLQAVGYTEDFAERHPGLSVSQGVAQWLDERGLRRARTLPPLPALAPEEPVWPEGQVPPAGRVITSGARHLLLQDVPANPDDAPQDLVTTLCNRLPGLSVPRPHVEWLTIDLTKQVEPNGAVMGPEKASTWFRDQELTVALLIQRGARATPQALAFAASGPNPRLVDRLLAVRDPDLDWDFTRDKDPSSPAPLMALATQNRWSTVGETIDRLLAMGVPRDLQDSQQGRNALHWAVLNDNRPVVHALLERGADPNAPDFRGHTAVHLAAGRNRLEVLDLLLLAGGDPTRRAVPSRADVPDLGVFTATLTKPQMDEGERDPATCQDTPILQAAEAGASATLARLLDRGIDPFPFTDPSDPASPRDFRALTLAQANQRFQDKGTSSYNRNQAALTVQRLEQHRLQQELTAIAQETSPGLAPRERPRM